MPKKIVVKKKAQPAPQSDRIKLIDKIWESARVIHDNRQATHDLESSTKDLQAAILAAMKELGIERLVNDDEKLTVLVVSPMSSSLNTDGLLQDLRARYPDTVVQSVTTTVIDQDALAAKVNTGEIDAALIKKHTTTTPRTPYVKVT